MADPFPSAVAAADSAAATAAERANKLLEIGELINGCIDLYFPKSYNKFFTEEGQKEICQNINNNIVEIRLYEEQIKDDIKNKKYNEAALSFGHILTIILDSKVNP